jgi:hypothetical protein
MFPDAHHTPSEPAQLLRCFSVSFPVALDLVQPEAAIRFGLDPMFGAAMPETAINEDRNLLSDKHDIRRAWQIAPMQPETESLRMQR